jgi:hypothetical protein
MNSSAMTESKPEAIPGKDTKPAAAPRWREWISSDFAKALTLVAAWQAALTAVAVFFGPTLPRYEGIPKDGIGSTLSVLAHTYRWDSMDYGRILSGGYDTTITSRAFYPLFPVCVWIVQTITFGQAGLLVAGFIVNSIAIWLAVVALLKIARYFFTSAPAPWLVVAAFLTAPTAFFLHSFYSEAVFCALGFWTYLFALRRQWLWMGLCLIPITASRVTAVLFVGLCFLEFWRSKEWKIRGLLSWPLLWFPAAFAGLATFMVYMNALTGDALGMFHALKAAPSWSYHVFNPNIIATGWKEAKITGHFLLGDVPQNDWAWALFNNALPFIGLVLLFVASVYFFSVLRSKGLPLALFGIATIVMLTMNSNVVSVHRYLLPVLVLYLALVLLAERRPKLKPTVYVVLYANSLLQAGLFLSFVSGNWTG